jgi:hypothetical protein
MRSYSHGRFQQQASFLRRHFLQDGDLPFANVLSEDIVAQALTATRVVWLDRVYSPLMTLTVFLGQVLSADHSCRAAVARLIAHRLSRGERRCSACGALDADRLESLTMHDVRHTFISHALAGGRTLAEVRDAAGHSNVSRLLRLTCAVDWRPCRTQKPNRPNTSSSSSFTSLRRRALQTRRCFATRQSP